MSTALYPDSPETAIFSCDVTIARRRHFSRDIASALGLWQQPALKRVQSHCLSSISENYNCAHLCTIIKSSVYTEHHSREKRYQALPRAREGLLCVYAYCRVRIKRPWAGNLKMKMKRRWALNAYCLQTDCSTYPPTTRKGRNLRQIIMHPYLVKESYTNLVSLLNIQCICNVFKWADTTCTNVVPLQEVDAEKGGGR